MSGWEDTSVLKRLMVGVLMYLGGYFRVDYHNKSTPSLRSHLPTIMWYIT